MAQVDWRDQQRRAEAMASAARTDADEAKALAQAADKSFKSASIVFEKFVPVTRTGLLSAVVAPQVASFPIPEAKMGDIVFVHRAGKPTNGPSGATLQLVGGVSIESTGYVPSDGVVEVYYSIPSIIVSLGSTLIIPLRLRGFRAS